MKNLRLIISLKCNFSCSYCCNNIVEVNKKFKHVELSEIDFSMYGAVSISGGEPTLFPEKIKMLIPLIHGKKYLYTNGSYLTDEVCEMFDGINIGIHKKNQLENQFLHHPKVRIQIEDKNEHWLNGDQELISKAKFWKRNQCDVVNEEWIILK